MLDNNQKVSKFSKCVSSLHGCQGSKQKISNGSDNTQVHNGINDTVSDHIGLVKEKSNDRRITSRSRNIYQLQGKIIS